MVTRKVYAIPVRIEATAYVVASTAVLAIAAAKAGLEGCAIEFRTGDAGGMIDGSNYEAGGLPGISLSPAMTITDVASAISDDDCNVADVDGVHDAAEDYSLHVETFLEQNKTPLRWETWRKENPD